MIRRIVVSIVWCKSHWWVGRVSLKSGQYNILFRSSVVEANLMSLVKHWLLAWQHRQRAPLSRLAPLGLCIRVPPTITITIPCKSAVRMSMTRTRTTNNNKTSKQTASTSRSNSPHSVRSTNLPLVKPMIIKFSHHGRHALSSTQPGSPFYIFISGDFNTR